MKTQFSLLLIVAAVGLSFGGCQTAKKPATSLAKQTPAPPPPIASPSKSVPAPSPAPVVAPIEKAKPHVEPAEAKPDPVAELIAKVETEYQAALDQASAGQNDAAKDHFDRAFKLLTDSTQEIRSDLRFQREFDRVQKGVNQLEAAAPDPAPETAAEQPKSEPAPIDEANEVNNLPADPNLKAKVKAELKATHSDLPLMMTDQVAGYINYFSTRGRGTLEHALVRSGRYREMIERTLKEEGVPQDLIYLAQAESEIGRAHV